MARASSRLQAEIKQSRPFRSVGQEALVGLMRTTDILRRTLGELLEASGITLQQYNVLRILRGAGADGLPTLEIAHRMVEHAPGITRLLDRIEAKGWVRRERCPRDRRQVLCWITPSGFSLLNALDDPINHADDTLLSALGLEEKRQLVRLLDRIRGGVEARSAVVVSNPVVSNPTKRTPSGARKQGGKTR